jgi:signal transduction histidine kinase
VVDQYPGLQSSEVTITVESPLLPVLGHEASLTQCVANLLNNALKFVAPGSNPHVRIWTEAVAEDVKCFFEDNGIGISPGNLSRIFGIFQRIHAPSEYEGTGIGLAIVRKSIERMSGTVGVESEPGKGSTFWLQLKAANP